jgi:alkanesulfonate monooxygenase SsuD/methylene tetrahydromethanopterin reductase-like flavin-dependent oxidoreductase (luciferase family)
MATGIVVRPDPGAANAVDDAIGQASDAFHRGVRQVWLGQRFDVDALTLAAVIATAVPGLGVGTAVVPINPRHPLLVASAAQTAQAAAHGNFSLGVLHFYDQFPSYQKIIAREGVTSAADLAVIGDPDAVIGRLLRYRAAGATDVVLSPFQTQPSTLRGLWAAAAEL